MKFQGSVEIHKPREVIVKYFSNPDYNAEYQDGFVKKELEEGSEGQEGAVSKMFYKHGNRTMVLTETITKNDLPDLFEAS